FQIEAQVAAQLHHPHIVPIFAVGCEQGIHYYAMQFVEGRSLAAIIHELRGCVGTTAGAGAPSAAGPSVSTEEESRTPDDPSEGGPASEDPPAPGAADPVGDTEPDLISALAAEPRGDGASPAPTLVGPV